MEEKRRYAAIKTILDRKDGRLSFVVSVFQRGEEEDPVVFTECSVDKRNVPMGLLPHELTSSIREYILQRRHRLSFFPDTPASEGRMGVSAGEGAAAEALKREIEEFLDGNREVEMQLIDAGKRHGGGLERH